MSIITARPVGMDYDTYKKERKSNQQVIKRITRGVLVYLSSEVVTVNGISHRKTYPPAIKHFDRNGNVIYKPMEKKVLK